MKKFTIKLLIRILARLSKGNIKPDKENNNLCIIKATENYLVMAMPNGDIIPGQLDLTVDSPFKLRGLVIVKCTFFVAFDNLVVNE